VGGHLPPVPHGVGVTAVVYFFATGDWNEERRGYRRRGNRDCPSTSQITKESGREGTTGGKEKKRNGDHPLSL